LIQPALARALNLTYGNCHKIGQPLQRRVVVQIERSLRFVRYSVRCRHSVPSILFTISSLISPASVLIISI
jgi:hypothetical protein